VSVEVGVTVGDEVGVGVGVRSAGMAGDGEEVGVTSSSSPPHALVKGKATSNKVMRLMNATLYTINEYQKEVLLDQLTD
jgi:hypothetical protein